MRHVRRVIVVSILTVAGLAVLVAGAYVPIEWPKANYLSGVAMSLGAALLLVPVIYLMEQQLAGRLDVVEASLADRQRLRQAGRSIGPDSRWEDIFPALEEVNLTHHRVSLSVKIPGQDLWIGFSASRHKSRGKYASSVMAYFRDPSAAGHVPLDTATEWYQGETGRDVLLALAGELQGHGRSLDVQSVAKPVFKDLREQVRALLEPPSI